MNVACVEQIAKAVLYEGYMLYPYRPSSVKNQQRWNFGVVYPEPYCAAQEGQEVSKMRTECLVRGSEGTTLEVKVRFLHLRTRSTRKGSPCESTSLPDSWQEAVERDITLPEHTLGSLCAEPASHGFEFPEDLQTEADHEWWQSGIEGVVAVAAKRVREGMFKVNIKVKNVTAFDDPGAGRDAALMQSLVSTHTILGVREGEFISLLEPPADLQELVAQCKNVGGWPVLVGEPGQRDTLLASPIILYDYPQIAPESVGDLFDGTEIDEILSLRIMTLTDEEKREIRNSDDRARQILERTETMPAEQFMKLHGVVRGMRPLESLPEDKEKAS
jgi:hydrogenase maturation protease